MYRYLTNTSTSLLTQERGVPDNVEHLFLKNNYERPFRDNF